MEDVCCLGDSLCDALSLVYINFLFDFLPVSAAYGWVSPGGSPQGTPQGTPPGDPPEDPPGDPWGDLRSIPRNGRNSASCHQILLKPQRI